MTAYNKLNNSNPLSQVGGKLPASQALPAAGALRGVKPLSKTELAREKN